MQNTIYQLIQTQAEINPENIAILDVNRKPLTYKGLHYQIKQVVFTLKAMGVERNDRVAIALPNGSEMAVAFLAVSSYATAAPLNPNYRTQEFEFYLQNLNAKALIIQPRVAEDAIIVAKKLGIPLVQLSPILEEEAGIFTLTGGESKTAAKDDFAQPEDVALILHTSGTTSRPKMVLLTHENLCISAKNIRESLGLKESVGVASRRHRCLNIMPLFHIHGLIGALLSSLSAGGSVVCTPGFSAPEFFPWLKEFRPTWYSAVPTMHQTILMRAGASQEIIAQSPLRFIRSSSASLPPVVMAELEKVFNAPVIESYGMTEAAHQMASNPLPPKVRKPGSVGVAAGPEIAIMDEMGNLLPVGEVGEVVIKGANVTQGYANNPEANEKAFTNGWFRTGDLGFLDEDGYLFLKGRIKEIINRGGEKISPREVDEIILEHPAIQQVVTFAAPHTLLGEDVAAAVVLKEGKTVTEGEIKEFVAARLADLKVPRVVVFLTEIPKGSTGKIQRIGLAEKLGLQAANPEAPLPEYAPPRTSIEEELVVIWTEVLKIERVGIYDNFFQLGGDSISAARIVNRVLETLQVELSFLIFFEQPTVAKMAEKITESQTDMVESEEMVNLLEEIESLSDEEVEKLLDRSE